MKKPVCVKDLDHRVPLQLARHGAVLGISLATPEDAALAQPLDEDALPVGPDQHASLQVAQELARDVARALVLDELGRRERDGLHAVGAVQGATSQLRLRGDPAAFRVVDHSAVHQLSSVVEVDQHLGKGWGRAALGKLCHMLHNILQTSNAMHIYSFF